MISTGIEKLNQMLKGGFPDNSIILLEGAPGVGKNLLSYHFVSEGLSKGEIGIYVYVSKKSSEIIKDFKAFGLDIGQYDKSERGMFWVDAFGDEKKENLVSVDLSTLYTINEAIKEILEKNKGKKARCVIDILSSALVMNDIKTIYEFTMDIIKMLRDHDVTTMMMIEEGMHDPKNVIAIEELADGVIELKSVEEKDKIKKKAEASGMTDETFGTYA